MTLYLNTYLLAALIAMVGFALYLSIKDHSEIKAISRSLKEEMDTYKDTMIEMGEDFQADIEYDEDSDEIQPSVKKEEIKLEVDSEMERINSEMRKNEILMEKLEKHYSSLRKVSKDIMESLTEPTMFQTMSQDYAPVPLMDSKPLWIDLSRNHIPLERGNLEELWEKYTDQMNVYSHMKLPAISSLIAYLFSPLNYRKVELPGAPNATEPYYIQKPVIHILNALILGTPSLEMTVGEERSVKKSGKLFTIKLNGDLFAEGKHHDILALKSIIDNFIETRNTNVTDEVKNIYAIAENIKKSITRIRGLLNWFIFEEDNMTQCDMVV